MQVFAVKQNNGVDLLHEEDKPNEINPITKNPIKKGDLLIVSFSKDTWKKIQEFFPKDWRYINEFEPIKEGIHVEIITPKSKEKKEIDIIELPKEEVKTDFIREPEATIILNAPLKRKGNPNFVKKNKK
jgi:hypothetical protein